MPACVQRFAGTVYLFAGTVQRQKVSIDAGPGEALHRFTRFVTESDAVLCSCLRLVQTDDFFCFLFIQKQ